MMIRGKSAKMTCLDVADGFTTVNPIFLKPLDPDTLKELYVEIQKAMKDVRSKFPNHDTAAIRMRNMKLQRLNNALVVTRGYALKKGVKLV